MAEKEQEASSPDELGVEIVDLDPPAHHSRSGQVLPRIARLMQRRRKVSLSITGLLVVMISGFLLASMPDVRGLLGRTIFRSASTTPALSPAQNLFVYLQGNPSWGQFTLDGHRIAHLPVIGHDEALNLAPGLHRIVWQAAPFRPKTCVFTVMDAYRLRGPCFPDPEISVATVPYRPTSPATVFEFSDSLNDLPTDQSAPLIRQVQAVLATLDLHNQSDEVSPGEAYALSEQTIEANPSLCTLVTRNLFPLCFARAKQPLLAHLDLQWGAITSSDGPCVGPGPCSIQQDCQQLCVDSSMLYEGRAVDGWDVVAIVDPLWSYTTLSGQMIASDQPDSAIRDTVIHQNVSLHIKWDQHGWHILSFSETAAPDLACNQGESDLSELLSVSSHLDQGVYPQPVGPTDQVSGCLIAVRNAQQSAYYLQRFGVVLAVNGVAHSLLPDLPLANAYEQGLAQKLLAIA